MMRSAGISSRRQCWNSVGIPPKLVRLTQATMEGTTAKVKVQNELSESFHIRNGLRQGGALACIVLNIALEKIICDANIN